MKLIVKNLGPIKRGEIDLTKKLYLFVGYNNSGKTYMSQLLWSLFKSDKRNYIPTIPLEISEDSTTISITEETVKAVVEDFRKFFVNELIPKHFNVSKEHFLLEGFGVEFEGDFYGRFKEKEINYFVGSLNLDFHFHLSKGANDVQISIQKKLGKRVNIGGSIRKTDNGIVKLILKEDNDSNKILVETFANIIVDVVFNKAQSSPFYIPANRIFYPTYFKYIYSAAKEQNDRIAQQIRLGKDIDFISKLTNSIYTEPVNDLIESIFKIGRKPKLLSHNKEIVLKLLDVMEGNISIDTSDSGPPQKILFEIGSSGHFMDMYLASSSVNQLTILLLYYTLWAGENSKNFLILDELESNLHPKNQIKVLNIILKFVFQYDNRLLLATHSPLITSAINNYLILGSLAKDLPKEEVEQIAADLNIENLPLNRDEVGVYFFNGQEILSYDIGEYGVRFGDFNKVTHTIENASAELGERLFEHLNPKVR